MCCCCCSVDLLSLTRNHFQLVFLFLLLSMIRRHLSSWRNNTGEPITHPPPLPTTAWSDTLDAARRHQLHDGQHASTVVNNDFHHDVNSMLATLRPDHEEDDELFSLSSELSLCSIDGDQADDDDATSDGKRRRLDDDEPPVAQHQTKPDDPASAAKGDENDAPALTPSADAVRDDHQCTCLGFFEARTHDSTDFNEALGDAHHSSTHGGTDAAKDGRASHRCASTAPPRLACSDLLRASPPASSRRATKSLKSSATSATASSSTSEQRGVSLQSWLDEALSTASGPPDQARVVEKKKRGRKPLPLSAEERAELVKKRNREHAQSTRRRQRMYVDYLKRQVALTTGGEADERSARCKAAALKFLQLRCAQQLITDRAEWRDIVAESCTVTAPCEPFRECKGTVSPNNRHRVAGIEAIVDDVACLKQFIDDLSRRSAKDEASLGCIVAVSMAYRVEPSEMMLYGEKLMCHWTLATTGLQVAGFPEEIEVEGMMKAVFNRSCRLVDVDLIYDVTALTKALQAYSLLPHQEPLCSPTAVFALETEGPSPCTAPPLSSTSEKDVASRDDNSLASLHIPGVPIASPAPSTVLPLNHHQPMVVNFDGSGFSPLATFPPQSYGPPLQITHPPGIARPVPWMNMVMPFGVLPNHVQPVVVAPMQHAVIGHPSQAAAHVPPPRHPHLHR